MSKETYIQVIQDILEYEASKKTFDDPRNELAWRQGYLIGMLAQIAQDDYTVANLLAVHLQHLTGKKKK